MLHLTDVKKDYVTSSETVHALRGINLCFRKSEFVSILGPSGCGKTTLLNIIGGLDHYTSGDLVIGGRSTKSYNDKDWDVYRNHRVGFIFQSYNLIPHQTILGNVELALTIAGMAKEERIKKAKNALDRVGLAGQYYKRPNQLSGGQCQRVAIARALVNDPEILLADEPTGALDTVTSVQIMNLIKEISGERLVIMVTHNPDLAERYSTRIVRLVDGLVVEDTNPFSAEDERAECDKTNAEEKAALEEAIAAVPTEKEKKKIIKQRKEKAKMSFFTAFMLSARNLISKKGRTIMVGIAGSIGIIGIALVLAFSAGIKGYIASMQDDMLSGNPIRISENAYDFDAIMGMVNQGESSTQEKEKYHAYISSIISYIAKTEDFSITNDVSKEYVDFVKSMPSEYYNAILYGYGMDMTHSIYTDFDYGRGGNSLTSKISIAALTSMYTSVLNETDYKKFASFITQIVPSFAQAPNNPEYIRNQYDVYGEIADEYDEVMIVLSSEQEISDMLLARLGYYSEEQFYNLIYKVSDDERYNSALDVNSIKYDDLLNKTFTWYENDLIYEKNTDALSSIMRPFNYHHDASEIDGEGVTLKVVGVLVTNENTNYGCLTSGIYYTEALTNHALAENENSEIAAYIKEKGDITSIASTFSKQGICYEYKYRPFYVEEGEPSEKTQFAAVGSMGKVTSRFVGGTNVANSIQIYPVSFDDKNLVTDWLDMWNAKDSDGNLIDITYVDEDGNSVTVKASDRKEITYTDALELVITMINTMIDVISYALIAFTSVSLVVSTVMIGIITYVSVVERVKEIGVIRSLGGRKKDVSYLFNAETFIIGGFAGLFGVGISYLISGIVNIILSPLIGYPSIAALPFSQALLLIALSIGLTLISGLIPARSAARQDPVVALRTE